MRVVVSLLLVFIACGGSKKPAESAESPAEPSSSSTADMPSESESAMGSGAPAASASAAPAQPEPAAPAAESAPTHPVPTTTGAIDGKPFVPKMARVTQPAAKDGRIVLTLDERNDCGGGDPKAGESYLTLTVPWEDGYKQDLGSLKRGGKKGGGEIALYRVNNGKKEPSATFKPTGRLTVVKAPSDEGAVGKLNIDMQSGEYMLSGDLDIQLCVAAKGGGGGGTGPAAAPPKNPPKAGKKKK